MAWAPEKTDQLEQAQEYYQIALSHSNLNTLYRKKAEESLRKIETFLPLNENVPGIEPGFRNSSQEKLDSLNWLFSPESANDEDWCNPQSLASIVHTLTEQKCIANLENVKIFCQQCWDEIQSERRRYQISSKGRIEILAADRLSQLINLKLVRFIQEGTSAPQVFWVIEHERGGGETTGPKLNGTDLVKRTRFSPPERASHTLDRLFLTPGIH